MKTDNLNQPGERSHGVVRGHTGRIRAASSGITFRDASTEATGVTELGVIGGTITDNDDGTAVLTIDTGITAVADPDPGTPTSTTETTQGTGMTISVPSDVVNGMFMLMIVWKDDDASVTDIAVTGGGWTVLDAGDSHFNVAYRIASNEPSSYAITYGPNNRRAIGVIVGFTDIDTNNPIAGFVYEGAGSVALSLPAGAYYLLASAEANSGAVTYTAPTGWTILAQAQTGGSYPDTAHVSGALAGKLFSGSDATSPITFGSNQGNQLASAQIALKKAGPLDSIEADVAELERTKSEVRASHLWTATPFPIVAHRGDMNPDDGYPENTIEALRQAAIRGAHGVEFDLCLDSESTWQVIHDLTVTRTTDGTGTVASKTTAQMAALNIDGGYGYNAGRHGTSLNVPTLAEAIEVLAPYDVVMYFDLKESSTAAHQALAQYIVTNNLTERSVLLGLTLVGCRAAEAIAPTLEIQLPAVIDGSPQNYSYIDRSLAEQAVVTAASYVQAREPKPVDSYIDADAHYGADEQTYLTNMFNRGVRAYMTNDLPSALALRNEIVLGITASGSITTSSGLGPLLLASDKASPIVFDDILQASDGRDFLYASEP